jgi:ABC-type sugar transport system permease subunit
MQLTLSFRQFELIFLITGGGPGTSTKLLTLNIFEKGMEDLNLGYANATGILSLVLVGVITAVIITGFSRTEEVSWEK